MTYYEDVVIAFRNFREAHNRLCSTHGYTHYRDRTVIVGDCIVYKYHNNIIAEYCPNKKLLKITNAGYVTPTTQARLNAILSVFKINRYRIAMRQKTLLYLWDDIWYIGLVDKDASYLLRLTFNVSDGELVNRDELLYYLPGNEYNVIYPRTTSIVGRHGGKLWLSVLYCFIQDSLVATMRIYGYKLNQRVVLKDCDGKVIGYGIVFDYAPSSDYILKRWLPYSGFNTVEEWVEEAKRLHGGKIPDTVYLIYITRKVTE